MSWSWAAFTSVNNAAWLVYFALSRFWTALVPASSAAVLAGALALMLAARGRASARSATAVAGWATLLVTGFSVGGRSGLGALLTAAFVLQVMPSVWTAYQTSDPSGVSGGTWALIFCELTCWLAFGLHKADIRLVILGFTGVSASSLMLLRVRRVRSGRWRTRCKGEPPAVEARISSE